MSIVRERGIMRLRPGAATCAATIAVAGGPDYRGRIAGDSGPTAFAVVCSPAVAGRPGRCLQSPRGLLQPPRGLPCGLLHRLHRQVVGLVPPRRGQAPRAGGARGYRRAVRLRDADRRDEPSAGPADVGRLRHRRRDVRRLRRDRRRPLAIVATGRGRDRGGGGVDGRRDPSEPGRLGAAHGDAGVLTGQRPAAGDRRRRRRRRRARAWPPAVQPARGDRPGRSGGGAGARGRGGHRAGRPCPPDPADPGGGTGQARGGAPRARRPAAHPGAGTRRAAADRPGAARRGGPPGRAHQRAGRRDELPARRRPGRH